VAGKRQPLFYLTEIQSFTAADSQNIFSQLHFVPTKKGKSKSGRQSGAAEKQLLIAQEPIRLQREKIFASTILALIAFLLYANTLQNGFVLDDNSAIISNSIVQQGIHGIPQLLKTEYRAGFWNANGNLYRPLSLVVFAILWQFFPNNPLPGHLLNCLIYSAIIVLLFFLLMRLISQQKVLIPFLITLLFVVHPLHTEVVANIKSLDELLSLLFVLLASHALLHFIKHRSKISLLAFGLSYFISLMSKEGAITFLAVFPLTIYFFTDAKTKDYLITTGTAVFSAFIFLSIRYLVLSRQTGTPYQLFEIDNSLVDARNFGEKTASCFDLLGKYIVMLFYPHPLSCDYSIHEIPLVNWNDPKAISSFLLYGALTVIALWRIRKKEIWVFGIAFFLITISLYSNLFFMIGTNFAERLAFTPSAGFCIAIVSFPASIFGLGKKNAKQTNKSISAKTALFIAIFSAIAAIGALQTFERNKSWKSDLSIYSDVKTSRNSARLNYWYGREIFINKGQKAQDRHRYLDTSVYYFNRAIAIYPEYAHAYAARGDAYFWLDSLKQAEADYRQAINWKVGEWEAFNGLGVLLANQNQLDSALKYFRYGLKVKKNEATIDKNIGNIYSLKYDFPIAISYYKKSLSELMPDEVKQIPEINAYLEQCYRLSGDSTNAKYYRSLLRK